MSQLAVLRLVRQGQLQQNQVTFTYLQQSTHTKTITTEIPNQPDETRTETVVDERERKVKLKVFGKGPNESPEQFFEVFEWAEKQLANDWTDCTSNQTNDATLLCNATNAFLVGTANAEWHNVRASSKEPGQSWKACKIAMATCIATCIPPSDAFATERNWFLDHWKPRSMPPVDWCSRLKTVRRHMKWFHKDQEDFELHTSDAHNWADWWSDNLHKSSGITDPEFR